MIRVYAALALCAALAAGGWYLHHRGYQAGMDHCVAAHAQAEADAREAQARRIARARQIQIEAVHAGDIRIADSIEASHDTTQYIIRTVHDHPAPAACVAPDRVRDKLAQAVSSANAAAGALRGRPASEATTADP